MRDRDSIKEFFQSQGQNFTDQQIDKRYARYGGAAGDLLQSQQLEPDMVENWDSVATYVLWTLVDMQCCAGTNGSPWNLRPITSVAALAAIQAIRPNDNAYAILQRLCDTYVLERDNLEYHVAYPAALVQLLPGATAFTECLACDDIVGNV